MDPHARDEFISLPQTAVLSTVDRRGRPHAVPVWYLYRDGEFAVFTDRRSAKVNNVRANGHAAITIDERSGRFRHVTAEGPVVIQETVSREERLALHVHYRGLEAGQQAVAGNEHEHMVILRLRPDRWY